MNAMTLKIEMPCWAQGTASVLRAQLLFFEDGSCCLTLLAIHSVLIAETCIYPPIKLHIAVENGHWKF